MQLLPTAFNSLGDPCLPDLFTKDYPPLPGVIMMGSLFVLFVIEMWLNAKIGGHSHGGPTGMIQDHASHPHAATAPAYTARPPRAMSDQGSYSNVTLPVMSEPPEKPCDEESDDSRTIRATDEKDEGPESLSTIPSWFGAFYEQSLRQHAELVAMLARKEDGKSIKEAAKTQPTIQVQECAQQDDEEAAVDAGVYRKMSTHITLLEGGILFHSVFVGMTVSITIDGFVILLIAILFHQMFEGLGLGSRIAAMPYPKGSAKPWLLVFAFGTTAPIGQAIGLLARNTYDPNSAFGLIIVGIFNAM